VYLFKEFGYRRDGQAHLISKEWPFTFHFLARFNIEGTPTEVFEFKNGKEEFYLVDGSSLSFYEKSGLMKDACQQAFERGLEK
jgi:hypothetical protein